jgi:hypothetical protein
MNLLHNFSYIQEDENIVSEFLRTDLKFKIYSFLNYDSPRAAASMLKL